MAFKPQLTIPEKGNPFYNTKDAGGYSTARKGQPTYKGLNVLHNCVGQSFGRFNQVANDKNMTLLAPVNAEDMWDYAGKCKKGQMPKLGAVMCWAKGKPGKESDGCGHVCTVEQVVSATEVITAESGWNNPVAWYNKDRKKGSDGNWGQPKEYSFRGFIYNPTVPDSDQYPDRIKTFQTWLNATYLFDLKVDGQYGSKTREAAVKALQTELNYLHENLKVDGGYGAKTKEALQRHVVHIGTKGCMALIVQGLLYAKGYECNGFDGSIGPGADYAIRTFQGDNKLSIDGRVGQNTFEELIK